MHPDELFKLFVHSWNSNQLSRLRLAEGVDQVLLQSSWRCERDQDLAIVADEPGQVEDLRQNVRHRKKRDNMDIILKVLQQRNRWAFLLFLRIVHLLQLEPVLDLPEPRHVVVRQHRSFVVRSGAARVQQVTARARLLLHHELDDDSIIYILA